MKISVIVPIYGVERFLRQCVDSILSQTHADLEILLVDDGSRDGCPAIVDEYAAKDKRIVAIHKKNGGYSSAVNLGLDNARGDCISIVEPDDWIQKDAFKEMLRGFSGDDIDIVKGDYNEMSDDGELIRASVYRQKIGNIPVSPFAVCTMPIVWRYHPGICTCLYKRSFLDEHAIRMCDAPGAAWTDNPFQIQTTYLARKIMWLDCPFYNYRAFVSGPMRRTQVIFDRCNEIHDWLDSRSVTDEMWAALYCRELEYLSQVSHGVVWSNVVGCAFDMRRLCKRMKEAIVKNRKMFDSNYRRAWAWYRYLPLAKILYTKSADLFRP